MVEKKCKPVELENISTFNNHLVYNNDCQDVLSTLEDVSVDGAVTSPPYYNARDYSHWDNIYCYLYDMYNHARGIYKVLKPGSYYLYNIFDYFDNENNVVFSAMGKKRLILGSYIIRMFTQIGFEITQNIIWYKGQIQGNRATNQGNNSQYYQAPLNCYEHILCFRKPSSVVKKISFPQIINVFPVVKIVKGENVLGHTAPFPHEIPDLLSSRIKGVIIDPYSGSFTTARSAESFHLKSISVEKSKVYCDLGLKLLKKSVSSSQPLFFDFGKEWGAYAQEDLGSIEDDLSHTGS
jgi:DNA modification methylase